jgi:hypothetical protein
MANVFGILTAIVLALAGFVAYKNKAAYETEITNTNTEKGRLKASQQRFDKAKNDLADTIEKRTGVDSEVAKLTEDEAAQKKVNADLTSQIKEKTDKVAANKEQLDTIRDKTAKVGDLKELAPKMTAAKAELEELSQSIIASVQSLPKVNTRIRSIYPTWGFVTLAAGNDAGVVANSTLDVVRDGTTVAKLLVTAVERNSSSASIIPDSVAQDVTLMVGDRVVPAQKAAQPAKN